FSAPIPKTIGPCFVFISFKKLRRSG
ncbi:hypothetical protein CP061683_0499B, partial [Chlamydia psittaci 06-1683]